MPIIGITGGVATGKSCVSDLISSHFSDAVLFSADAECARLVRENSEVRDELQRTLGEEAFSSGGHLNRQYVRSCIFGSIDLKRRVEAIFHPRVRQAWRSLAERSREKSEWMFAEIPLLYETGGWNLLDRVVVVACSPQEQIRRMVASRGLSEGLSEQIRVAQMSLTEKCSQSDHIIWNDFSFSCLSRQVRLLCVWLRHRYS